ncbi:MAG TPA: SusC/RagA family TonB-linked outer membrane protein [Aequorivita sp.]|nr:SusC/RagA family TonB-linked outer membrane protein [Aequorivita sp.]
MRTKFSGILTLILALVVQLTFAQQKTITGTVTDDTGLPLPGANVIVKGTSSGTQSDFDGNYTISANVGQTLVFSYVGFVAKEIKVGAQNKIDISLQQDAAALEEVVVTGYSTRNQTVQTSAVVSISASELSQMAPTTSIDNMLQGKAAGVQVTAANGKPGQGAFVRIRGMGSLVAGASSPLYIVDGAPIREVDLANIPNEDIENITILKDAATTARYGSRGANGVVVISTKNGNRNKDAVIRFSSRYGVVSRVGLNYKMMNASEKMQYESEMYAYGQTAAATLPGVNPDTAPGTPGRQFLLEHETDWEDLVLKDGIIQNNAIAISGGSERMDYYFSVSNDRNTGIIDKIDGFERTGARLNVNFDAKDWLALGVSVGYSRSTSDEPRDRNNSQNPFRHMLDVNPYETEYVLDEDGSIVLDDNGDPVYNQTLTGFPVRHALETEPSIDIDNQTIANVDALVKFTKNWSYNFNVAVNWGAIRRESYSKPGGVLDIILNGKPTGNKFDDQQHRVDLTISNRLNYSLNSNNHNLNVMGLYEFNQYEFNRAFVRKTGFASPLLSTQTNASTLDNGFTNRSRITLLSYGLFADYDYKEKYLLSGSIRRDGSSNFGTDYKYGTFWSASLGWNLAKENFFSVDAVNDLKLRASYGSVGNRNGIGYYDSQGTNEFGSYPGGSSSYPANTANPELKWETTTTTNIGLELNMFNNRLRLTSDYFIRDTKDLLFKIPTAQEAGIIDPDGVSGIAGNLGKIQNKGLEIALQGDLFRSSNFKWTLGGNIIFLDTEVVELPDGEDVTPETAFNILFSEGHKINEHYLIRYAGVDPENGRSTPA